MKKHIFLLAVIFISISLNAQNVKKIKTLKAGTLSTLLSKTDKATLTDLTISGAIDARDFAIIRNLEGLECLDLSAAKIVYYKGSGGTAYRDNDTIEYKTDEIPSLAFSNLAEGKTNKSLKTLILPNTLTSIGVMGIMSCDKLTSVKCPKTLVKISDMSFQDCLSLTQFEFGENVNYVGSQAFMSCSNLKTLTFNSLMLDGLDSYTFDYSHSLKSIYVNTSKPPIFNNMPKDVFSQLKTEVNNITVFVKPGTLQLFKQDPNWNVFPNIVEL